MAPLSVGIWLWPILDSPPLCVDPLPFFFLLLIIIIRTATLKVTDICMQPGKVEREGSREGNETKMVSERMTEMHSPLHKLITVNVSPVAGS